MKDIGECFLMQITWSPRDSQPTNNPAIGYPLPEKNLFAKRLELLGYPTNQSMSSGGRATLALVRRIAVPTVGR